MVDNIIDTSSNSTTLQNAAAKLNGVQLDVTDNDKDDGIVLVERLIEKGLTSFIVDKELLKYAKSVKLTKTFKSIMFEILRQLPLLFLLYIQYTK